MYVFMLYFIYMYIEGLLHLRKQFYIEISTLCLLKVSFSVPDIRIYLG